LRFYKLIEDYINDLSEGINKIDFNPKTGKHISNQQIEILDILRNDYNKKCNHIITNINKKSKHFKPRFNHLNKLYDQLFDKKEELMYNESVFKHLNEDFGVLMHKSMVHNDTIRICRKKDYTPIETAIFVNQKIKDSE